MANKAVIFKSFFEKEGIFAEKPTNPLFPIDASSRLSL